MVVDGRQTGLGNGHWILVELNYGLVMDWQISGGLEECWNMVGLLVADSRVGL